MPYLWLLDCRLSPGSHLNQVLWQSHQVRSSTSLLKVLFTLSFFHPDCCCYFVWSNFPDRDQKQQQKKPVSFPLKTSVCAPKHHFLSFCCRADLCRFQAVKKNRFSTHCAMLLENTKTATIQGIWCKHWITQSNNQWQWWWRHDLCTLFTLALCWGILYDPSSKHAASSRSVPGLILWQTAVGLDVISVNSSAKWQKQCCLKKQAPKKENTSLIDLLLRLSACRNLLWMSEDSEVYGTGNISV